MVREMQRAATLPAEHGEKADYLREIEGLAF